MLKNNAQISACVGHGHESLDDVFYYVILLTAALVRVIMMTCLEKVSFFTFTYKICSGVCNARLRHL